MNFMVQSEIPIFYVTIQIQEWLWRKNLQAVGIFVMPFS